MMRKYSFKLLAVYFTCIFFYFFQISCQKKNGIEASPPVSGGVHYPTGIPDGVSNSKDIGPEGGTISSADNTVIITVPAGALAESKTIGIEAITNTNPAALGNAFRLTPHGQQFNKPVSITFNYSTVKDSINVHQTMGLAYQDNEGIWQFTGGNMIDTILKTVTYKSMHFSDWSMMPRIILKPYKASLGKGEELTLQALYYIPISACNCDDDIFVPFPDNGYGYPVGMATDLDKKYIGKWDLSGPGTLIPTTTNQAAYKAPANLPLNTSATVSLTLKSSHTLILVSNIQLVSDNSFELRINNGNWKPLEAGLVQLKPGKFSIATTGVNTSTLSMFFPSGKGNFIWGEGADNEVVSGFNYFPSGTDPVYMCKYYDDQGLHTSGGSVIITESGNAGEFVTGSFSITPCGLFSDGLQKSTATVEGRFRLRRAF